jgi:hypothetical protein
MRCASADIEDAARPSNNLIANAQIAITESDLTADARDIGLCFEPVAAVRRTVEVNC